MVKFCTYNARGINDLNKRKQLFCLLKHKMLDLIFIQESHGRDKDMKYWRSQWGGDVVYANAQSAVRGVTILMRRNLDCQIIKVEKDLHGRFLIVEVIIDGLQVVLANVYGPNIDSPSFFAEFMQEVYLFDNSNVILGGDFNFVIDQAKDRKFSHHNNNNARDMFLLHAQEYDLVDVWRELNPDSQQYSCCRPNSDPANTQWQKFSRLDMFFISRGLLNSVKSCTMHAGFQSDHSFVIMNLETKQEKRGPGHWKFNNSHLHDKQFNTALNALIDENIHYTKSSPIIAWQMLKGTITEFSKAYGKDKAKAKRKELEEIETKLDRLKSFMEELPSPEPETTEEFNRIKNMQSNILQHKANGAFIRSRTKFYDEGERSSKYYFSLEKHNNRLKTMSQLRNKGGAIITGSKCLLKQQQDFYSELYKSNTRINFNLNNDTGNLLKERDKKSLDEEITLSELTSALRQMPNNKSPGLDGLTVEVYKMFWAKIGPTYHAAVLQAKKEGTLWQIARKGLITLIPKKDKDMLELTNWRPLTMLTCDYKILAKALAARLSPCLQYLISPDQTGYMKNRNIAENLAKTAEIISYTHNKDVAALIMTIDFQKCFDSLEHTAIFGSLRYFGFGDEFIKWTKILFKDFQLCCQSNGYLSQTFKSERSVHQGCPLAGSLYLLTGQILHDLLCNSDKIKSVGVHDVRTLISQFADDTTLFLMYDQDTLDAVVDTLEEIENCTGLTVNYDKTSIYRIGSLAKTNAQLYTTKVFHWTNQPVEILGVKLPTVPDNDLVQNINYQPIINRISQIVTRWGLRTTTLSARILLINSLIASLFVYKMQVLPNLSSLYHQQFLRITKEFLWQGGSVKITPRLLTKDKSQGGLRLVDLQARQYSLKAQWVTKLHEDCFWTQVLFSMLPYTDPTELWSCNLNHKHAALFIAPDDHGFWFEVLEAWCRTNFSQPTNVNEILNQYLWYNSFILVENKPYKINIAKQKGLTHIYQLFDNNGRLKSFDLITQEYHNPLTWFQYTQLIDAIPNSWKSTVLRNYEPHYHELNFFTRIHNETKIANLVYSRLINDPTAIRSRCERWNRKLIISTTTENFCKLFKNMYTLTISTKLRDFQYRLLTGILVTNKLLYLWKITDTQLCTFCRNSVEDEIHLFCECRIVKPIWQQLKSYIQHNQKTHVLETLNWSPVNIIFNTVHPKSSSVINFLVLITKQYIYRLRCMSARPTPNAVCLEIEKIYNIELCIAQKKQKLRKHAQKWSLLKDIELPDDTFIASYIDNM